MVVVLYNLVLRLRFLVAENYYSEDFEAKRTDIQNIKALSKDGHVKKHAPEDSRDIRNVEESGAAAGHEKGD